MKKYSKIQSIYKRDPATKFKTFLPGEYSEPEFEYLKNCDWTFTEKIDGMNMRVIFNKDETSVRFAGRTDRAEIHPQLMERVQELFPADRLDNVFTRDATLYGEGYGPGIQSGGWYNVDEKDFILFDILIDGEWWLDRGAVEDIAGGLEIKSCHVFDFGPLSDAEKIVREGFNSFFGDGLAEGIVARPLIPVRARDGSRIITKIKTRDYK